MATTDSKDTIYVDIDDEITSIIEKVRASDGKIVALVLPKRASVLQSVVNMKLLKRTAENAKKHLVLVTSEAGLMPLAGSVGLHVASSPTSKPIIPAAPDLGSDEPEDVDEPLEIADSNKNDGDDDYDPKAASKTPIGDLAGAAAVSKIAPNAIDEELNMDDDSEDVAADDVNSDKKSDKKSKKDSKKLRVPNFDSFRKKIILAVVILIVLIAGYTVAFVVLPKATVTIHTDTSDVTTNLNLSLDASAKALDTTQKIVPAISQATSKSYSQQVPTTGQQNNGVKANGTVKFTAQKCSGSGNPDNIATGTGVSNSGQTYITQEDASFSITSFSAPCATYTSNPVDIIAQTGGAKYNTASGVSFTVSGRSDATGSGTAGNGTDNIIKTVMQADIDSAKAKITSQDTSTIKTDLVAGLQGKGEQPISSTFLAGDPQVSNSANVGDSADTVTVTEVINYTMLGVKQSDLKALVDAYVNTQIDQGKQVILDDGVAAATFTQQNPGTATTATIALQAKAVAGPEIDTTALKKQLLGKKAGDITTIIKQTPGVTDVDVKYSPFWVSSVPSNAKKLTVVVDKASTATQ